MESEFLKEGKVFNDPIYGFINIPSPLLFQLVEHPYFQRLRRISQLGLTHLIYPGALHTRFHHAMGAMHLMTQAIDVIRSKGHIISDAEAEAAHIAILLHDIGHGPFSHSLESSIVGSISHEEISIQFMEQLNIEFGGKLDLAIKIFRNKYKKKFLHQLIASQLDVDRLDYLKRDSFYCGVAEGVINVDRIIKMLNVSNDKLAIDSKGIYSVESFIIARRLMYWQVYLHKTSIACEILLINILKRAKELSSSGAKLFGTKALTYFIENDISKKEFENGTKALELYAQLDDHDIYSSIKEWMNHKDKTLSYLAKCIINRNLSKVELSSSPFSKKKIASLKKKTLNEIDVPASELKYYFAVSSLTNRAYTTGNENINVLFKNDEIVNISEVSDQLTISALSIPIKKHLLYYPKSFQSEI
ncbi:MAG: HD domain-containing protein [Flavobacteriales bacterium]|nr:HD domain-containing protein [Flavobacteriales bacterium]